MYSPGRGRDSHLTSLTKLLESCLLLFQVVWRTKHYGGPSTAEAWHCGIVLLNLDDAAPILPIHRNHSDKVREAANAWIVALPKTKYRDAERGVGA